MNWITRLFQEINELIAVMASKLNTLNTIKEDNANKQNNLSSTNANHYPNVPAVNTGLTNTLQSAQTYTDTKIQQASGNYIPLTAKGAINGVAELDTTGRVPASQLPSYVDDVEEVFDFVSALTGLVQGEYYYNSSTQKIFYASSATTAANITMPESDKIYVRKQDNTTWRWSGTAMVQMNAGLALGTTASTAYRGDHGLIAYTHANATGNPHNTQISDIANLPQELAGKSSTSHTHNAATATQYGFAKLFSDTPQNIGANAVSATSNRTYGVQVNSSGQIVVNVPWVDTIATLDSLAVLNAGTSTTGALQSAKNLNDWANNKYVNAANMGDPTVAIPDWSTQLQTQTPSIV